MTLVELALAVASDQRPRYQIGRLRARVVRPPTTADRIDEYYRERGVEPHGEDDLVEISDRCRTRSTPKQR